MLCLVAVSLSACKKHAPVASQETCSNEYLEKHHDLQKLFKSDGAELVRFEQSCALVKRMEETAKREKALKALMGTARTLTTGETCSKGYVKNHPEFLKDHLPIAKSDSGLISEDDVRSTFSEACYDLKNERREKLLTEARAIVTKEACSDGYVESHPQFLKDHLPISKNDSGLISEDDVNGAFSSACYDFEKEAKKNLN